MRRYLKQGKRYDQHRKLELVPPEKKRMKNDELVEHLLENHRVRILTKKNGVTSHELNGYPMKKSGSSKKQKGRRVGKRKTTWRWMKRTPLRELILDLADVEMIGST